MLPMYLDPIKKNITSRKRHWIHLLEKFLTKIKFNVTMSQNSPHPPTSKKLQLIGYSLAIPPKG